MLDKLEKLVIFGTGMSSFSFLRSFPENEILFFLDNNANKQYSLYRDRPILPPVVLQKLNTSNFKIVIASEFYGEISTQLIDLGLEEEKDFVSDKSIYLDYADFFLISYMKCGRTWLRFMIGKLFEKVYQLDNSDKLIYTDGYRVPGVDAPIIKAYHDDNPHQKSIDEIGTSKLEFKDKKIIFMIRDPRDVAVSLYYHFKYRSNQYKDDIDEFVKRMVPNIVRYFNVWLENKPHLHDFLMVRYEDLHTDSFSSLRTISTFLGFGEVDPSILESVIEESSFERMNRYEKQNKAGNPQLSSAQYTHKNAAKVRKGKVGSFREELQPGTIAFIDDFVRRELNGYFKYGK